MKQTLRKLRGWSRWSHSVADYYPVSPRPRWGHGLPRHPRIAAALERWRPNYERVLADLEGLKATLHAIPFEAPSGGESGPYWDNVWFSALDAASLVGFLTVGKPQRYMEIGSGYSTLFARHAIRRAGLATTIASIDPKPRAAIDLLCDRVVRQPLEDCDLAVFDVLEAGDILFFDGSHRVFTNSDVSVFFFEVLPRLKPGVLVHVHDIFLPDDYTPGWNDRLYSEQYLLAAMLLCPEPPFQVILPNYFVTTDPDLGARLKDIFRSPTGGRDIPMRYANGYDMPGVSFWFEMRA